MIILSTEYPCLVQSKYDKCETSLSHSSKWKNSAEPVLNQTNIIKNLNNINANEYSRDKLDHRRRCRVEDEANIQIRSRSRDVRLFNTRLFASDCVQSSNLSNDLSKSMIRCTSCQVGKVRRPAMTYANMQWEKCKQKTRQENRCCQNYSVTKANDTKMENCKLNISTTMQYLQLCMLYLKHFIGSRGKRIMSLQIAYAVCLLFIILSTSATHANFAERRYSSQRGMSPRYPRHSGFRRNSKTDVEKCETITIPTCKNIGYNKTDMSLSFLNKFSQNEAQKELDLFTPLMEVNCSAELKLFLCSLYTPICMKNYGQFLPPCRFVCERARSGCLPIMQRYGYKWPMTLECEQFPPYTGGRPMCMHFNLTKVMQKKPGYFEPGDQTLKSHPHPRITVTKQKRRLVTTTAPHSLLTKRVKLLKKESETVKSSDVLSPSKDAIPSIKTIGNSSLCICRQPMVTIQNPSDPLYNKVTTGCVPNCAVSCKSPYFSEKQISAAETWIKSWSIVCFVVTLMTVSTFLIDMDRFKYPERPIIFLSTCYMFVSIGFLIRIIAGHEAVACASRTDHVLYHTTGPMLCTVVFILVYFFGMASSLWWVILSMTWFLASGLKWGSEAIEKYSQYYHAAAWLIPSLKTIMILAMSSVDGDSLSGICLVGNQDVRALRGFVLAPLVVYLALGGMFLFAGFVSLFRIRNRIKQGGKKTDKLEKLMGRIGIFSVLYMVPAAALVACYFYEQQYRPLWEYSHNCKNRFRDDEFSMVSGYRSTGPITPEFIVFMVRYLMTLLIGITNGVWICSPKTLESWKKFYRRCACFLHGTPYPKSCSKDATKPRTSKCDGTSQQACSTDEMSQKYNEESYCKSLERESETNRCDSCLSRSHETNTIRSNQNNYQIKFDSKASSSIHDRSSKDTRESSRASKCDFCIHSSRSSESIARRKRQRKRRETRSSSRSTENGIRIENTRTKSNITDEHDSYDEMCCNITTSTDGSDHINNGNLGCVTSVETRHKVPCPSGCSHSLVTSEPCEKHYNGQRPPNIVSVKGNFCSDVNTGKYVINHDDLLPTRRGSHAEGRSHVIGSGESYASSHFSDCIHDEVHSPFLNSTSSHEIANPEPSLPLYHHYHHHYHK